jgi:HTH-type transcriptional repressor of NAD biosynthesis genes
MEKDAARSGTGMILGKFLPPHLGHRYLVDFARNYVEHLTVLDCSLKREPIPGELRYAWMREMFPGVRIVHVTDEVPQEPQEHPDFWRIWHDLIRREIPSGPDYVFASEDYGYRLAEILGAEYVPVDPGRIHMPVSGTAVRERPMANWRFIPDCVRPYFVKRVCLMGPESTGKTVLAERLARHFDTAWVCEYARPLLDSKGGRCDREDIPKIIRGQAASEGALARRANRVLICDTDLLTTTIWSEFLFGECPEWIRREAASRKYDLTLLMDSDCPWVDDDQRFLPHQRREFHTRCRDVLEAHGRPTVEISGTWDQRFESAVRAVEPLLQD